MPIALSSAEYVVLSGKDAVAFAQAQFTNDVLALAIGTWQWSAWLDAQGRARSFFALLRPAENELRLWPPLGGAAALRDEMSRFVFRAAVTTEVEVGSLQAVPLSELHTRDVPDAGGLIAFHHGHLLQLPGNPHRVAWLAPASAPSASEHRNALDAWRREDIAAGLPFIAPALAGEFVPQALELEGFDAIRFDKGCYPGQEVAARLHFRGGNKRHPCRFQVDTDNVAFGAEVTDASARVVGRVLYAARNADTTSVTALAVVTGECERDIRYTVAGMAARAHD